MVQRSTYWARSLFKGRIGEALVESILAEFGYRVQRAGYEQVGTGNNRIQPDLLVAHPAGQEEPRYVEVKYRSARPTSVMVEPKRVQRLAVDYPGTVFAFVSAYDGAVYCADVEDIASSGTEIISLLSDLWKPITAYFGYVQKGQRLTDLWTQTRKTMEDFGTWVIPGKRDHKLWDGEYDAIEGFLSANWEESYESLGIQKPLPEQLTLEERWEVARRISAAQLAVSLFEDDEIHSPTLGLVIERALGNRGEEHAIVDIPELATALGIDEAAVVGMLTLIASAIRRGANDDDMKLIGNVLSGIPDGVGLVNLASSTSPYEESEKVDFKTFIKMAINPCRIDR